MGICMVTPRPLSPQSWYYRLHSDTHIVLWRIVLLQSPHHLSLKFYLVQEGRSRGRLLGFCRHDKLCCYTWLSHFGNELSRPRVSGNESRCTIVACKTQIEAVEGVQESCYSDAKYQENSIACILGSKKWRSRPSRCSRSLGV